MSLVLYVGLGPAHQTSTVVSPRRFQRTVHAAAYAGQKLLLLLLRDTAAAALLVIWIVVAVAEASLPGAGTCICRKTKIYVMLARPMLHCRMIMSVYSCVEVEGPACYTAVPAIFYRPWITIDARHISHQISHLLARVDLVVLTITSSLTSTPALD